MALIGTLAINMTTDTRGFIKGMTKASATLNSFGKIANTMFKANPMFTMLAGGVTAAGGIKQIGGLGRSFREAAVDARTLAKAGLLDASNSLRIFRNVAADALPGVVKLGVGLSAMGVGAGRGGLKAAAMGLRAVGKAATFTGHAFVNTFKFAGELASKMAILGGIGALGIYKTARAASSLAEQTDRARVVFGDAAGGIIKDANLMGEAFGVSRSEFIASASEMGGMLKGMGYAADDAAKLGVHFAKLATDVAAATQTSVPEAMERMRSGLSGEAEAVRKWGVDLSEANLKTQAARLGIAKMGAELSQTQKIQIRSILMDEKLAYAKGNLAKTAGGAEQATMGLMGRLSNLAETIGTALLPIVGSAMSELQVGVQALSMAWTEWTKGVVNESVGVIGAQAEISKSMGWVQTSIGVVADSFQNMSMAFSYVQSYVIAGLGKLVGAAAKLGDAIGYIVSKVTGMPAAENVLTAWAEDLKVISAEQYKAFEMKAVARPASEGINAAFLAAQGRIGAARQEAMKPGVNPADLKPTGGPAAKAGEPKYASAALAGSQEAANAVLRSRYGDGAGGRKPEEETAKNTRKTADMMTQAVQSLNRLAGFGGGDAGAGALGVNF